MITKEENLEQTIVNLDDQTIKVIPLNDDDEFLPSISDNESINE